jgi:hypothetical protein
MFHWNVATYKWKVHNEKIAIISFVVKFHSYGMGRSRYEADLSVSVVSFVCIWVWLCVTNIPQCKNIFWETLLYQYKVKGRRGRDHMIVGFTITCLSCEFESRRRGVLNTTLCDKVCQWLATARWFSTGTTVSCTNKTDCYGEVVLNTITNTKSTTKIYRNLDLNLVSNKF